MTIGIYYVVYGMYIAYGSFSHGKNRQEKGPLVYQESKLFNGETFLINVYDHTKRRVVTFETYGLESQDQPLDMSIRGSP